MGGVTVLDLEDQDKVAASSSPQEAKTLLEAGRFCGNFFGVVGSCFCWGFWQKRGGWMWFFGGEVVVDCWLKLGS